MSEVERLCSGLPQLPDGWGPTAVVRNEDGTRSTVTGWRECAEVLWLAAFLRWLAGQAGEGPVSA